MKSEENMRTKAVTLYIIKFFNKEILLLRENLTNRRYNNNEKQDYYENSETFELTSFIQNR